MKFELENYKKGKKALGKRSAGIANLLKKHQVDFLPQMQRSPYESLIRAIAHQQLHGKAAETILGRMLALFPKSKFPSAEEILSLEVGKLRACGFSESKVKSINDIALKAVEGFVPTKKEVRKMSNEVIVERLTEIHGVGPWTVEMLLIFQLGRLDVWPVDDFGVRRGFQIWKKKKEMPTAKELRKLSKDFAPYQTIMALHLWREADLAKKK